MCNIWGAWKDAYYWRHSTGLIFIHLFVQSKLNSGQESTRMICYDSFYFTPGYMLGDWFIFPPQLRYPLIHMEKLRRWQKISSLIFLKTQTWQLWYWGWCWVSLYLFLWIIDFPIAGIFLVVIF
jgi:hypothetical protein